METSSVLQAIAKVVHDANEARKQAHQEFEEAVKSGTKATHAAYALSCKLSNIALDERRALDRVGPALAM